MGLRQLYLVNPVSFPHEDAQRMAAAASDILEEAVVSTDYKEAISDCKMVVVASCRSRSYDLPTLTPEESADCLVQSSQHGPVALVFGPERFGVDNQELLAGRYRVEIPTSDEYASLNLASSVQILAYEIQKRYQQLQEIPTNAEAREFPSSADLERFYAHLERTFSQVGFINHKHPGEIMQRLQQLFARAQPDAMELNILRGMLSSVDRLSDQRSSLRAED